MHEKRKNQRIPIAMTVQSVEIEPIGFGYAFNISRQGLGVDALAMVKEKKVPEKGADLKLKFKIPKSEHYISALATVVYIDFEDQGHPKIGFEFKDISNESLDAIEAYIKQFPRT